MQTNFPEPKYFLCYLTTRVARKMTAHYDRVLAPLGLTCRQMIALGALYCCEEGVSLGRFAKRAGIGKAAAVTMIQRLENMGLVKKGINPQDGRLNALLLTQKARDLAPLVAVKVADLEQSIENAIGKQKLKAIFEGLYAIMNLKIEE